MSLDPDLRSRPIKSLAWLGDAIYELEVRSRLLSLGDFHPRDLDKMGASLARAETQAALLLELQDLLDQDEQSVAQRGKNASLRTGGRSIRNTKEYRIASGLEALVAHWHLGGDVGIARMQTLLGPRLDARAEALVKELREKKSKRG